MPKLGRSTAASLAALAVCSSAAAQESLDQPGPVDGVFARDRNVSVRQRPRPGYEALGVRLRSFYLYPRLEQTLEYNDNVYAAFEDEQSDLVWRVRPEVSVASDWSRHSLQAYARATFSRFNELDTENTDDLALGVTGRADLTRATQLNSGLEWARVTEPRTAASAFGLNRPVQFELGSLYLMGTHEIGRVRMSARADTKLFNYINRPENPSQHDRDHLLVVLTSRAEYALSPDTAAYVQLSGNERAYRHTSSPTYISPSGPQPLYPGLVNRNSQGAEVLVGGNFELGTALRGDIGLGYLQQGFEDATFRDVSGFSGRGRLEWFPTQLTTVTATAGRSIESAGIAGSTGSVSTTASLQVDHELLRNLILTGTMGYGIDDYRGLSREDERTSFGASATYLLSRRVGLNLGYLRMSLRSSGLNRQPDFDVQKLSATLTLQY